MIQLVQPDFSVTGRLGFCLEYASRLVFHNPAPGTTAWQAWLQTKFRVSVDPNAYIAHWFSGAGGAGHVVIGNSVAGYHSSPYSLSSAAQYQQGTTTHALLPTIAEVERIYGVKYVGSSLDILGLKVAEEDDMSTIGDVEARILIKYIYGYRNELDIEGAIPGLVGGESNTVIRVMDATPTAAAYQQQIKEWQNDNPPDPTATVLKPGKYQVN